MRQIIPLAGDGQLGDGKESSRQFRGLLAELPLADLTRYADECLHSLEDKKKRFPDAGYALQDVVNETGVRIGFSVESGRYHGVIGQPGHDGLWRMEGDPRALIVEVKTSDTYRIHLDTTVVSYRRFLVAERKIDPDNTAFLVVVGSEDTGGLEAQIRGSRHAWDCRMISVDALMRLAKLREEIDSPDVARRIREILFPKEFTKLDEIVEALFFTAEDSKQESDEDAILGQDASTESPDILEKPVNFLNACVEKVEFALKVKRGISATLVRRSGHRSSATFLTPEGNERVICLVSKNHSEKKEEGYFWFTLRQYHAMFLNESQHSWLALGCGSAETVCLIPWEKFSPMLDSFNPARDLNREGWHIHIIRRQGHLVFSRKAGFASEDASEYLLTGSKQ